MTRNTTLGAVLTALALILGCDSSPGSAENQARDARRRAAEEAASVQRRADEAAASAMAKAEEEGKRAEQVLIKARNDLHEKTDKDMIELSARMDDLRLKSTKATGKAREEMDAKLQRLDKQIAAVKRDLDILDRASAAEFDAMKARIEVGLADLKKSLSEPSPKANESPNPKI